MKPITFTFFLIALHTYPQGKYMTKTGTVNFEASVSSFEEVKASNKSVSAILNSENDEFAVLVLVNGFHFKNALMEEHFNENYAESDKFPKGNFKGKISHSSDKHYVNGILTFHGKSKQINQVPITYTVKDKSFEISGSFQVNVSDFEIKIPKIVQNKVSESVNISFDFILN